MTTTKPAQQTKWSFLSPEIATYFISGGAAGAASRTVVSPLERLKIIQQVQPRGSANEYKGVWRSLVRIGTEEGWRGYFRGNMLNCIRIVPYSAVQFTTYEQLKKLFTMKGTRELGTPERLTCGALAGITSVCTTYPLDLIRARVSIATASLEVMNGSAAKVQTASSAVKPALSSAYHTTSAAKPAFTAADLTMKGMTYKIMREEGGVRALYKGMVTTSLGVAPYVGINFAAYELFRGIITPPGSDKNTAVRKLACGALAGTISQTLTYPFDVLRRKMQVTGMQSSVMGQHYNNAYEALTHILKTEGIGGIYRGIWPNLLKVAPSIATSFFTYELVKDFILE